MSRKVLIIKSMQKRKINKPLVIPERVIQSNFFKEIALRNWQDNVIFAFAIKNEVGKNNITTGFLNKLAGVQAGMPDVCILDFKSGKLPLFLEFKTIKGKQADSQKEVEIKFTEKGYIYRLVRTTDEAIDITANYFKL